MIFTCVFSTVPPPSSITVTSSHGTPDNRVIVGTDITLTCTVRLNRAIVDSDISLLNVTAQFLSDKGVPLTLSESPVTAGTTFTFTTQLDSFRRNASGNYTCNVTVSPQATAAFVNGTQALDHTIELTTGEGRKVPH